VLALWVKRQALETDTWTETSSELLENEDIQEQVSGFLVTQLFDNVDVKGEIEQALPPRLVIREFPDRVSTWSSEGLAQGMAARMRDARERRVTRGGGAAPPAEDERVASLERLAGLRDSGVLTPEEFEAEKRRILGSA
jgi:hypothetical protein